MLSVCLFLPFLPSRLPLSFLYSVRLEATSLQQATFLWISHTKICPLFVFKIVTTEITLQLKPLCYVYMSCGGELI